MTPEQLVAARPARLRRLPAAVLAILALLAGPGPSAAAAGASPDDRPRIGLVLGGGGAKGAAHVGVLKVLDELRIPVDCVAGTSMGALIGASFAAGASAQELEAVIRRTDWSATVGSAGRRDRAPIDRKLAGNQYSNTLELGLREGRVTPPGGLLKTQGIEELLRELASPARFETDFDALPIPFRAVATDLQAGEMVVLGRGDLAQAMRASMAVPGVFAPALLDGRVLADGGLMRNLPVDIARDLCADVVIAVSLPSPVPAQDRLLSPLGQIQRAIDVVIEANQTAQLASLTDRDVAIVVPMGDIGSADFDRTPAAIPLGEAAARAMADRLRAYSLPEADYRDWRARVLGEAAGPVRLADVKVRGLSRVSEAYVRAQLETGPGDVVTTGDLSRDTSRLFALGDFERVDYRLTGDPANPVLEINAEEKSWGPDFVTFDLGMAASTGGEMLFVLRAEHRRTWINALGGEWRNELQVGEEARLGTSLYQPLDIRQRYFVQPALKASRSLEDVFVDGDRLATYELDEVFARLDGGVNLSNRAQLRVGLEHGVADAEVETGDQASLPVIGSTRETNAEFLASYDTRDTPFLPTRGSFLRARYLHSATWLGGETTYDIAEAVAFRAFPWRGNVLYVTAAGGGGVDGDLPPYRQFLLGGIRSFPGLQRGELRGDSYWTAGAAYLWKLGDIQSLFGQALYAGLRLQAGRMGGRVDQVRDGAIYGASVSIGGRTPLGPLQQSRRRRQRRLGSAVRGRPPDLGRLDPGRHPVTRRARPGGGRRADSQEPGRRKPNGLRRPG